MYQWCEIQDWLWTFQTPLFTAKVVKNFDIWQSEVNPLHTPTYRSFFRSDEFRTREGAIEAAEHVMIDVAESTLQGMGR